jgi:TRAP-type C4-dicarboxylate transport system substrate-binding protein
MNKKRFLVIFAGIMTLMVLMSGCGGATETRTSSTTAPSTAAVTTAAPTTTAPATPDTPAISASSGVPQLDADAAKRADDAYAFVADLKQKASAYDASKAEYRYILNNHDPAASAVGEFLTAWSDAVLVATEGKVYIEVGHSNSFSTGGTMATLDEMISGSIDFDFTLPCYFKGYMPLTLAIQNAGLGIKNATVAANTMWELYKNNADIQAEYADDGEVLFVWANNPSPLSYKGTAEITDISGIKGNIRGNNGPAQIFITKVGASVFGCPIGEVYTNVSTGVMDYLITDWHGIASFSLYDDGVLNHYLDTNIGCSAYTLMANDGVWAEIEKNGYADAIKSVSGDYLLNLVGIWEAYEAKGRDLAKSTGGNIYAPNSTLAGQLDEVYAAVAEQWISDTGGSAKQVYDQAAVLVEKYASAYK